MRFPNKQRILRRSGFPIPLPLAQPLHPVAKDEKIGDFASSLCPAALTLFARKRMLGPKSWFCGPTSATTRCRMHCWDVTQRGPAPTGIPMPRTILDWRTFRPAEGFYTSLVEAADRYPVRTFLPTGYEPNYPYPLLVFMHGHGGNEEQSLRLRRREPAELRGDRPSRAAPGRCPSGWPGLLLLGRRTARPACRPRTMCSGPSSKPGGAITFTPNASTWPASAKGRRWRSASH